MFYKTQIQSVTSGGAVDVNGRSLRFIGYLPIKAGDIVFTDGNVIFGNAPPKGAPAVFDMPSGIPVLADYDSSGANELRGYFTDRGKFKPNKIKGDTWIANDKKTYKHDTDDSNIIDAEIASDGSLYTVEKVITQNGTFEDNGSAALFHHTSRDFNSWGKHDCYRLRLEDYAWTTHYVYYNIAPEIGWSMREPFATLDYIRNDETVIRECTLIIAKGDEEITRLNLSDLAKGIEDDARASINIEVPNIAPEDHIKSRTSLLNFKILSNGSWTALLKTEIAAVREFRNPLGTVNDPRYRQHSDKPFVYFIDDLEYDSTAVYSLRLVKISSNGSRETLFALTTCYPLIMCILDSPEVTYAVGDTLPPYTVNDTTYPYKITSIVHTSSVIIGPDVGLKEYGYLTGTFYDSRNLPDAPDYDNVIEEFADEFTFPVQDDYRARITNYSRNNDMWRLEGIYDADGNRVCRGLYDTFYHKANLSFAKLKGGSSLLGIHQDEERDIDGVLYKIDAGGGVEQVGSGLKNFRLRELKNIGKARR